MLKCSIARASLSHQTTSFIQAKQIRAALKKAKTRPNKTYRFPKAGTWASHERAAWVLWGAVLGWAQ